MTIGGKGKKEEHLVVSLVKECGRNANSRNQSGWINHSTVALVWDLKQHRWSWILLQGALNQGKSVAAELDIKSVRSILVILKAKDIGFRWMVMNAYGTNRNIEGGIFGRNNREWTNWLTCLDVWKVTILSSEFKITHGTHH